MVFSSLVFLFRFLPAVLGVYYLAPECLRNSVLLIFSLVFYAWGEPVYILLMAASIITAYAFGLALERKRSSLLLCVACIIGVGVLAFFKYSGKYSMPVGISFYTFQTLSYLIDVYRGHVKAQRNIIAFGMYISMFPQLIAGPIVRYSDIETQLTSREVNAAQFARGVRRFVAGLGKKVLLANNAGALWEVVKAMNNPPALTAWLGLSAYTFQIYFDFSGYSDMAIGLGEMFGFEFCENFRAPYTSKSITEFWRRWHISLGTWFKEYVYIPLGGSRSHQARNIIIVWALTGVWHGAGWNFLAWGMYYAALLLMEKFILREYLERWPDSLRHLYCMFFVMIGWCIFAFDDLGQGFGFTRLLFGSCGVLNCESIYLLRNNVVLLVLCLAGSIKKFKNVNIVCGAVVFMLSVAWLVDESFNPFLYFRF